MLRKIVTASLMTLLSVLLLGDSPKASGQAVNGTLLGTVTDSTGAVVSNTKVVVTETTKSVIHESITNESGNYTVPDLPPGSYSVAVEATGFKKYVQQNIALSSNSTTRVDIVLQAGSVSESVTVTSAPPVLQTDRADITTKIETEQVMNMPLGMFEVCTPIHVSFPSFPMRTVV